jgi:hypothetical protein
MRSMWKGTIEQGQASRKLERWQEDRRMRQFVKATKGIFEILQGPYRKYPNYQLVTFSELSREPIGVFPER